jgi:epoxyqueuosine reductase
MEQLIQKKAYELGYEKCGIIPINRLEGYEEKFNERIQKAEGSERFYQGQKRLVNPLLEYPWAKSVVVLTVPYAGYEVMEEVADHIGKSYLFDIRVDERTEEFKRRQELEAYMQKLGLQLAANHKFGIVALRWAALQAGLGIIRRNNFFYTESGSWVHLEAWLTDGEMELIEETKLKPCPKGCDRCIKNCPTSSLSEAYTMNPLKCISFLTTFGGRDLLHEPLAEKFGDCIYGCDICQDVCPMNHKKWIGNKAFPGLAELAPHLTAEGILSMEEEFYISSVQPKFFYLSPQELWKWQVNALNYLNNRYKDEYKPLLLEACKSKYEKVRDMAEIICVKYGLQQE